MWSSSWRPGFSETSSKELQADCSQFNCPGQVSKVLTFPCCCRAWYRMVTHCPSVERMLALRPAFAFSGVWLPLSEESHSSVGSDLIVCLCRAQPTHRSARTSLPDWSHVMCTIGLILWEQQQWRGKKNKNQHFIFRKRSSFHKLWKAAAQNGNQGFRIWCTCFPLV